VTVETFVTGPFQENCYLVIDEVTRQAAIVDPGDDALVLVAAIRRAGVELQAIWLTHAHLDHIGAVAAIRREFDVPIFLHPADLPLYRNGARQAEYYGLAFELPPDPPPPPRAGMSLPLGGLSFEVLHAPGHAPGHVVIHGHGVALVGDCLFAGSIGRTDLPLADGAELARSLSRITALPPETRVLPGHGPVTTIEEELRTNPYLGGRAPAANR